VKPTQPLIVLELNEVTFPYIQKYLDAGATGLETFRSILSRFGFERTTSETRYEDIEPWIQWVTAHTGKSFAQHGIFRLGDIVHSDLPQVYEILEEHGVSVGAVSPMNAANRCKNAAFFIPDPWTKTNVTASPFAQRVYETICRAVGDNATGSLGIKDALCVVAALARFAAPRNYRAYVRHFFRARQRWHRVAFLDLLIADMFFALWHRHRPQFSTLFVNGAAHVQHHYMYNAQPYAGSEKNPAWYVKDGQDPLLEIYRCYDRIVSQALNAGARLFIATGLSQEPFPKPVYYWRLKNHAEFLQQQGIVFEHVEPKMSRDFLMLFKDEPAAELAAQRLAAMQDTQGEALFEVDNRGNKSVFATLTYPHDVSAQRCPALAEQVVFVALKNGHHSQYGYFCDVPASGDSLPRTARAIGEDLPLSQVFDRVMAHFAISELR
jgi:hypothetical protein